MTFRDEPKFDFAKRSNTDTVNQNNENQSDCDKDCRAYAICNPTLHDESKSRELIWRRQEVFAEVDVSGRESESWINKSSCVAAKATRRRHEQDHLAERSYDKTNNTTNNAVVYENSNRASLGQCRTA